MNISDDVLDVLARGTCNGNLFTLPAGQLDRKLYARVNAALEALGGQWNRRAKAHVFATPCTPLIGSAVETGQYIDPQRELGFFPTPAAVITRMLAAAAPLLPEMTVLEPSAGDGAIVRAVIPHCRNIWACEIDAGRAATVQRIIPRCIAGDFLREDPFPKFDRIIMNPPFANRQDIAHVNHALRFLRPGGVLVSVMSAGVAFRTDSLAERFRATPGLTIEPLPDGSFLPATAVRTVLARVQVRP